MSLPFIGEIRPFAIYYNPYGWLMCNGAAVSVEEYEALYAVIGTTYGGDGRTTFNVPNFNSYSNYFGQAPVGVGRGAGLSNYLAGMMVGEPSITLTEAEMPEHNHKLKGMISPPTSMTNQPVASAQISRYLYEDGGSTRIDTVYSDQSLTGNMAEKALVNTGASQPHNNCQPLLSIIFCIAWDGIYPSPS